MKGEQAMGNSSELWTKFKEALMAEVRSLAQEGLLGECWGTETGRTKMYTERIVPGIGQRLGLEYVPEWLNIDGGYWDRGLARIFLETENNAQITYQEMDKLCHVRAPLKVLIT